MLKNLKKLREDARISQKQLAEIIGVSQQSINKYENHSIEPDIRTLICIADYFSTSVDYLIGHTDIRRKIEPVHSFDLNETECNLVNQYRNLNSQQQSILLMVAGSYDTGNTK